MIKKQRKDLRKKEIYFTYVYILSVQKEKNLYRRRKTKRKCNQKNRNQLRSCCIMTTLAEEEERRGGAYCQGFSIG